MTFKAILFWKYEKLSLLKVFILLIIIALQIFQYLNYCPQLQTSAVIKERIE